MDENMENVEVEPKRRRKKEVYYLEPGDTSKIVSDTMALAEMPPIDVHNPEQLKERLGEYFQLCADRDMKPSVSGMGLAIGLDRRRLYEINSGAPSDHRVVNNMPKECRGLIKKAYQILDGLWENMFVSGKINPVVGIFLGKNHFGYKDQTEQVVVSSRDEDDYSAEEIARRYLPEPEKELPKRRRGRKKKTE